MAEPDASIAIVDDFVGTVRRVFANLPSGIRGKSSRRAPCFGRAPV